MEFELSTEQKEIQELALKFARNEMFPVSQQYDEEGKFPKEIFKKAWELGLINTCIPTEYGGTGFSSLDAVVISEALAWGCMGMNTSFMANDLALLPIVIGGSDEQKKKFLTPFTEEFRIASFCLTEPGNGSDAGGIKTTLKDGGDHWILNGEKMWITNAGYADLFVVYATINPELKHKGITAVVVDPQSAGIEMGKKEDKMGHRSSDTRGIRFNNVKVPKENTLGKAGDGWAIAMSTLDHSRPLVASSALGGAQRAMELSISYSKERIQFGVPIAKHQAVQFMIAEMGMKIEAARLLTYKAAWMCDKGEKNSQIASYAKAFASDSCMQITTDAVQIYGGYGYSKEYPVEKLMRDAKLIQIYEGTSQIQRLVMARELLK
ncbi:MAG: acyl-CoA dehydrogenase family protein [Bacteriovoracaceae bacterium]